MHTCQHNHLVVECAASRERTRAGLAWLLKLSAPLYEEGNGGGGTPLSFEFYIKTLRNHVHSTSRTSMVTLKQHAITYSQLPPALKANDFGQVGVGVAVVERVLRVCQWIPFFDVIVRHRKQSCIEFQLSSSLLFGSTLRCSC